VAEGRRVSWLVGLALLAGCGWADDAFCGGQGCGWEPGAWQRLATLANPPAAPADPTNRWADDPAVAALGKRLFFDPSFSGPSRQADSLRRMTNESRAPAGQPINVSCATCHDLGRGGIDDSSVPGNVSVGAGVTDVNALPVINSAYRKAVFWNARLDSLWGLNLVVAESDTTLNGNRLQTAHVLADHYGDDISALFSPVLTPDWRARAAALPATGKPGVAAYDGLSKDDQALAITLLVVWAKAIAAYERQLVSRDSAFDRFIADGPRSNWIPASAQRGARLFVGKAACIDCHNGPLLTDDAFHDVGVPQSGPAVPLESDCTAGSFCDCTGGGKNCLPWGAYNGLIWMRDTGPKWYPIIDAWNDDPAATPHAPPVPPFDPTLKGAWRTPSLRDVALTAPYMHDGVYQTLSDVLWHYNTGGRSEQAGAVGAPAVEVKPIGLSEDEIADLAEFLQTLTGAPLDPALIALPAAVPDAGTMSSPDGGIPDAATCIPGNCAVPATVQSIFAANCETCHPPQNGLSLASGSASYASLVGVMATGAGCTDRVRVVPGSAGQSYLIAKLRNRAPICGAPMPFGYPMLPEAEIQTIEAWINGLHP
jgi:cytochrome c peroxidase